MRVLVTFEMPELCLRSVDFINLLISYGHEISLYAVGVKPEWGEYMIGLINHPRFSYLKDPPEFNDYRIWIYDLSSRDRWKYPSLFWKELVEFRNDGLLICVNYEDGYHFFDDRITDHIKWTTSVFMNNAVYIDRMKYPERIRNKLLLSTSYISNSQPFRNVKVPYDQKTKRVFFSGSVTGNSTSMTNFSEWEPRLRIILAEKVYREKTIPSIIRFFSCDPVWQKYYDEMPVELKSPPQPPHQFVDELSKSKISLCVKGNSYPTNRFFESMAAGCLTFSTKIDHEIEVYGTGQAGKDYVEINVDGSDLIPKIHYYLDHSDEAKVIADSGRKTWEKYNMLDDNGLLPLETQTHHVEGVKTLSGWDIRLS